MWVDPTDVVNEMKALVYFKPVDVWVKLLPYDLLIEYKWVPFWGKEVVKESCLDGEFFMVVECWFVF